MLQVVESPDHLLDSLKVAQQTGLYTCALVSCTQVFVSKVVSFIVVFEFSSQRVLCYKTECSWVQMLAYMCHAYGKPNLHETPKSLHIWYSMHKSICISLCMKEKAMGHKWQLW